jgi:hypothetical protein
MEIGMDDEAHYHVVSTSDAYQVTDPNGRTTMTCKDARSAEHYAVMLTRAFQLGYRAGYRAANASPEE